MSKRTLVLDKVQIEAKINRIVREIHEKCFSEKSIIICGIIEGNGEVISKRIAAQLEAISKIKVELATIFIDKENPLSSEVKLSIQPEAYEGKTIIIVDDVSNSGKTLMYAVKHFMQKPIKAILPLVLVDRSHNRYPVKTAFVGLTISTTLQDHIHVEMNESEEAVYLV